MIVKNRVEMIRAIATPNINIRVLEHWNPRLQGTIRRPLARRANLKAGVQTNGYFFLGKDFNGDETEMWSDYPPASKLQFNEDGSVTFHPGTERSWTLAFELPGA